MTNYPVRSLVLALGLCVAAIPAGSAASTGGTPTATPAAQTAPAQPSPAAVPGPPNIDPKFKVVVQGYPDPGFTAHVNAAPDPGFEGHIHVPSLPDGSSGH